ncbi:hypothetical protein EUX98_g7930 [Antrodiella citrinella]|uniref:Uncharacterized protein n=1 Tax=Antrodiella citrinella TaxID=2447956 RepID=A0A4S4ME96_9APHY|nr:hypothetical protein EUX98_g7930 [Antrodiella citrinella]
MSNATGFALPGSGYHYPYPAYPTQPFVTQPIHKQWPQISTVASTNQIHPAALFKAVPPGGMAILPPFRASSRVSAASTSTATSHPVNLVTPTLMRTPAEAHAEIMAATAYPTPENFASPAPRPIDDKDQPRNPACTQSKKHQCWMCHKGFDSTTSASTSGTSDPDPSAPTPSEQPKPKRRRRAPSPSHWIPDSLRLFNLMPIGKATPVPLAPVQPYHDPRTAVWEERDSFDVHVARRPYHPEGWSGKLPGPGISTLGAEGGLGRGTDVEPADAPGYTTEPSDSLDQPAEPFDIAMQVFYSSAVTPGPVASTSRSAAAS